MTPVVAERYEPIESMSHVWDRHKVAPRLHGNVPVQVHPTPVRRIKRSDKRVYGRVG